MLIATDYLILRGITANGRLSHDVDRQPIRVVTLIDEAAFLAKGNAMIHHKTVFFEDRMHDWDWSAGKFRYYTSAEDLADVVLIYAEKEVTSFCTQCGTQKERTEEIKCDSCKDATTEKE